MQILEYFRLTILDLICKHINNMKARLIFFSFLFATVVFTLLSNCSGGKKAESDDAQAQGTDEKAPEATAPQFVVNENFQQQLGKVFTSYVSLKDALVASDAAKS